MATQSKRPQIGILNKLYEAIGKGYSVINGMHKGAAQAELEVSRKNWIINPQGKVGQRDDFSSAVAMSSGDYNLDRWLAGLSTLTATVEQAEYETGLEGWKMVLTNSGTGYVENSQRIEDYQDLSDKTITITVRAKCVGDGWNFYFTDKTGSTYRSQSFKADGSDETISMTIKTASDTTRAYLYLSNHDGANATGVSGDYFHVGEVKIELGDTATPFISEPYAEVLRKCQRYYWQGMLAGGGLAENYGATGGAGGYAGSVTFPVTMRVEPTIAIVTAPTYSNCSTGDTPCKVDGFAHRVSITSTGNYRAYNGVYSANAEL